MTDYRLYFLCHEGRHIKHFTPIEAEDALAAVEITKLYRGRYALELWCRDQKIVSFSAYRDSAIAQTD